MFLSLKNWLGKVMPAKDQADYAKETREMRENLSEKEIDKALKDSFPASDPTAWY